MASSPTAPDSATKGGSSEPSGDSSNERFDVASAERFAESLVPEWEATLHSVEIPLPPESTGTGEPAAEEGLDEEPTVADPPPRAEPPTPAPTPPPPSIAAKQVSPGAPGEGAPQSSAATEASGIAAAPEVDDDAVDLPGLSASPRSRKGLYVGLGAAVLLVVVGVATTMGSGEEGDTDASSDTSTASAEPSVQGRSRDERAAGAKDAPGANGTEANAGEARAEAAGSSEQKVGANEEAAEPAERAAAAEEPAEAEAAQGDTDTAAAGSDDREATPAAPRMVVVQVTTSPADAELYLDGERVDNPLRLEREADDARHRLEARAEGYRSASKTVRFDRNQRVVLKLKRARNVRRATHPRVRTRPTRTRTRPSEHGRRRVRKIVTDNPY